jgi:hypothetical protein
VADETSKLKTVRLVVISPEDSTQNALVCKISASKDQSYAQGVGEPASLGLDYQPTKRSDIAFFESRSTQEKAVFCDLTVSMNLLFNLRLTGHRSPESVDQPEGDRRDCSNASRGPSAPQQAVFEDQDGHLLPPPERDLDDSAIFRGPGVLTPKPFIPFGATSSRPAQSNRTGSGPTSGMTTSERRAYIEKQNVQQPYGHNPISISGAWGRLVGRVRTPHSNRRTTLFDGSPSSIQPHAQFMLDTQNSELERSVSHMDAQLSGPYSSRASLPIASQFPRPAHGPLRSRSDSSRFKQCRSSSMPSLHQLPLPTSHLQRRNSVPSTAFTDTHFVRAPMAESSEEPFTSEKDSKWMYSPADNLSTNSLHAGSTHDNSRFLIPPTANNQSEWSILASKMCDKAFLPDRNPLDQRSSDSTRSLRDEGS